MEQIKKYFAIYTFLYICCNFPASQGLECYQCAYVKGLPGSVIDGLPVTDKCEKKVPDDYKTTCTVDSIPEIPGITFHKNNITTSQEVDFTCAKVHADIPNSVMIYRGCIPKVWVTERDESKLGTCTAGNLQELADQYEIPLDGTIDAGNVDVKVCFCDGNSCNSARGFVPGSGWIALVLLSFIGILNYKL